MAAFIPVLLWYFAVMKFNLADLLVKKAFLLTKKKSMLMLTELWCVDTGSGNGILSILLDVDFNLVISSCNNGLAGLKICVAQWTSSRVTSVLIS